MPLSAGGIPGIAGVVVVLGVEDGELGVGVRLGVAVGVGTGVVEVGCSDVADDPPLDGADAEGLGDSPAGVG